MPAASPFLHDCQIGRLVKLRLGAAVGFHLREECLRTPRLATQIPFDLSRAPNRFLIFMHSVVVNRSSSWYFLRMNGHCGDFILHEEIAMGFFHF